MTIKAILFDMDGVLIEAKDWHYESLNQALGLFGKEISRIDHLTTFDGLPTRKKLEMLNVEGDLHESLHEFINQLKQQYTHDIVLQRCVPVFAHERALAQLRTDGYRLAVCSNSVKSSVELMMKRSHLEKYLELQVSNEDVKNGKPDPEMYLKAMDHFGLHPSECLILEDNENGIKAAKASGGHCMIIDNIYDVNLENVYSKIREIDMLGDDCHGH
jgi:HAD superfamily hydrolase (TIGR01509 family)